MNILGKDYTVSYLPDDEMQGMLGTAMRSHGIIRINTTITVQQQEETLLHETIHIIDGELNLGLSENAVARLSVGLYSAGYRLKEVEK